MISRTSEDGHSALSSPAYGKPCCPSRSKSTRLLVGDERGYLTADLIVNIKGIVPEFRLLPGCQKPGHKGGEVLHSVQ